MSTEIAYDVRAIPQSTSEKGKSTGWLQRIYNRLLAAREAQATRYLLDYLSGLSDTRLAELGYTDEQIQQIRKGRLPN
ncbi:MAG: hypothetical protein DIU57_007555 [Pseudomonadota bacterium]|jgi:hypothetical protein|nr:MAG: hypothetical protein DIU57_07715 [Pseudomonadota bacterium]